jgi:hypothetical protein
MVAAFVFAATAPAMAQAQAEPPGWGGGAASWGTAVERVLGWLDGLWSAVAGSETETLSPDGGDMVEGGGEGSTDEEPPTQPNAFPLVDPNG